MTRMKAGPSRRRLRGEHVRPIAPRTADGAWQDDIHAVNVRYLRLLQRFAREGRPAASAGVSADALAWLGEQPAAEIERMAHRSALLCCFAMPPEQVLKTLRQDCGRQAAGSET